MNILGIETSCDETAAAVVKDGTDILSNIVVSQIDIFAEYGGVIPEIAARSHLEAIHPVISQALQSARLTWNDIDAIAVTHTPGLLGSLLIGTLSARTFALIYDKPLYPIHHLKSHIYANWLKSATPTPTLTPTPAVTTNSASTPQIAFPILAPVISGGHTQLIYMTKHNHFKIIGTTRDDAIGECFDKVAKILGLPYPGGPAISKLALSGDRQKHAFPHPKVPDYDFSFSGLKTAVLRTAQAIANVPISHPSHQLAPLLTDSQKADIAASFEENATDIILEKLRLALHTHPASSIVFAGGVSANNYLRQKAYTVFQSTSATKNPAVFFPAPKFSGDNGAMVASAAFFEIQTHTPPTDPKSLKISPTSLIS